MSTQLSLTQDSTFIRVKDIPLAIEQIEKQLGVKFQSGHPLKTQKAFKEAESLEKKAAKIKKAGDIDTFLEITSMIQKLKDASIYHAYKSASFACIKKANEIYLDSANKNPYAKNKILEAKEEFTAAKSRHTIDGCIASYVKAYMLAAAAIKACKAVNAP